MTLCRSWIKQSVNLWLKQIATVDRESEQAHDSRRRDRGGRTLGRDLPPAPYWTGANDRI
jgi:hypothetical protein